MSLERLETFLTIFCRVEGDWLEFIIDEHLAPALQADEMVSRITVAITVKTFDFDKNALWKKEEESHSSTK